MRIGLNLDVFWSLDPKQYNKHIEIYIENQTGKVKFYDELMHTMGTYILTAFHEPGKYPKKPYYQTNQVNEQQSDDEMERMARKNTILMGGEIN